jgi:hypothetical protein
VSHSSSTLHVRDVTPAKVRAALASALASKGWEPFDESIDMNERDVRRYLMVCSKGWVSVAGQDGELLDDWAGRLSKKLHAPVLTIFTWDGEAVVSARRFEDGHDKGSFELPREAERGKDGRARVRCGAIEPWLDAKLRNKLGGWLVVDDGADESLGEEEGYVYVSEENSLEAIGRVLDLEHVALDAYDEDLEGGTFLAFRPTAEAKARAAAIAAEQRPKFKGRMPVLPPLEGAYGDAHRDAYCLADYAARGYAVGWIAFDAPAKTLAPTLLAAAKPLVDALMPDMSTWERYVAELTSSGAVDLCDVARPDRKQRNLWLTLPGRRKETGRAPIPAVLAPIPAVLAWSVPKSATDAARSELAAAMDAAMMRALAAEACIGACAIGTGRGRTRASAALPYEVIAGTDAGGLRLEWVRTHVRSPGWRVLVPKAVASRLPRKKPAGVELRRGPAGVLVASTAPDVFAQLHQEAEPLERHLLDLVGTARELRAMGL